MSDLIKVSNFSYNRILHVDTSEMSDLIKVSNFSYNRILHVDTSKGNFPPNKVLCRGYR